ncbi:MAG: SagB/ThcOx family dehydrogenase [Planctomycetota bacterium]|nr:SagB/ThcOx family dehydrogenase [Planctomycetota bacterium]
MADKDQDRTEKAITRRGLLKAAGVVAVSGIVGGAFTTNGRTLLLAQEAAGGASEGVDKLTGKTIALPAPQLKSAVSVEEAIAARRSRREYQAQHISLQQLGQLLWCAQGVTKREGKFAFRAAPSAGALYPMDIFAVLPGGVYRYKPHDHELEQIVPNDRRKQLKAACVDQKMVTAASVNLVITANYEVCARKYGNNADDAHGRKRGESAERYCIIESGCISENIHIQCETLKLGTVLIGAFEDAKVIEAASLPAKCRPLLVMPVGPA